MKYKERTQFEIEEYKISNHHHREAARRNLMM